MKNFICLFLVFMIVFFHSCSEESVDSQSDLSRELIGFYPFNGNANDESGQGKHGSANASLTSDRKGMPDKAYLFDGIDDNILIQRDGIDDFTTGSFTFCAWIETEGIPDGMLYDYRPSVENGNQVHQAGMYTPDAGQTRIYFRTYTYETENFLNFIFDNDPAGWHFIVFRRDGLVHSVFTDGEPVVETTITPSDLQGYQNLYIGSEAGTGTFFKGKIDDIRIYNRALSDEEIAELYLL